MNKYAQHYIHHYNYTLQKLALDPAIPPIKPVSIPTVDGLEGSALKAQPPKHPTVIAQEQATRNAAARNDVNKQRSDMQAKWNTEKALALKEGRQPNHSVLD